MFARWAARSPQSVCQQVRRSPFFVERVCGSEEDPFTIERACKDKTPPNHKEHALKEGEFRWERASYKEDACGLQSVRCTRKGRKTRSVRGPSRISLA